MAVDGTEKDFTVDSIDGNVINKMKYEDSEDQEAQQLLTSFANYVTDNSEKITQLIKNVARMIKDVEDLKTFKNQKETMPISKLETKIDGLIDAIEALKTSDKEQEKMIENNTKRLKTISTLYNTLYNIP